MSIKELREKQLNLATEARSKFNEIADDTPEDRAAEIEREFDAMMAEHDKIGDKIERLAKLEKVERGLQEIVDAPAGENKRTRGSDDGDRPVKYHDAFLGYLRAGGNVAALAPEERAALHRGYRVEPELRAQTAGTDAAGGYTVPQEMAAFIVKSLAAWGPMANENVISMIRTDSGHQITIPTVNDTSRVIAKTTEGTTLTDDGGVDITFGEATLDAYAYDTEWLRISKPLLDDSAFPITQFIGELLGEGLARRVNTELTTGDGVGDPNGVVTASAAGLTAASATAIAADEVIELLHSVDPAYRMSPKAAWMFNDSTLEALRKLKDGQNNYLWQMGDVRSDTPATLLGKPYYVNQAMASIATGNKTMLFGDFGKYYVRMAGDVLMGVIQDKDFWPGVGIAGYVRIDGELPDTAAVKHLVQL